MWLEHFARFWEARESGDQRWTRTIYRPNSADPYLRRYFLLSTRWIDDSPLLKRFLGWASFRLVLHHTLESDEDGLHDHPWPWASFILSGGYWENTPEGRFWRGPGTIRFRSASALHRLELDPNTRKEVWSLFLMGRRQKEWGFLDRTGQWVPHEEHIRRRTIAAQGG